METSIIPISNLQLSFSVLVVLIAGGVSAIMGLGLLRSLVWGTLRTFVQLTLIGYVLAYIFRINNFWMVTAIIILMCFAASRTATRRTSNVRDFPSRLAFISLFSSTLLCGSIVTGLIISPEPWYSAQIVVPIFGMILGNSMNGIALSLDRLYSEAKASRMEIDTMLSFGAAPWEAIRPSVSEALRAGMMPTINSLMTVGLVSLPGMMTGQILGGVDPREAVRYQIVVMLMVAAAVAAGCLIMVGLSYKRLFNEDGALDMSALSNKQ